MKIVFTNHARERMRERGILEKNVIECVHHSDRILKYSVKINRSKIVFRWYS